MSDFGGETEPAVNDDSRNTSEERPYLLFTIPNLLCFLRLAGSPVLLWIAWRNDGGLFLIVFLVLLMTDWIDGKLAILLNQKSVYGARLDSIADAALYTATLFGVGWLEWDLIRREAVWLLAVVISYALTSGAGLLKYGRLPSYHTRAAKTCWLLAGLAVVSVLTDWADWPLRVAAGAVVLTNLEAVAITAVLPEWTPEVRTLAAALRKRKALSNNSKS
jgi:CDP-diacylglycerol--glycerol-3-phosphate 3-phosphatidyltransferase